MKAPFPYFGGKRKVANEVWDRFGNVPNYCEPFAGSLAVLLARPHKPKIETVNDIDCMIANFWRAVQADPDAVASFADWPVNETDIEARHLWLVNNEEFTAKMKTDPNHYDAKVAGWWVWGISSWIGSGWCEKKKIDKKRPHLMSNKGVHRKLPHLGNAGRGVHRKLPHLGDAGMGVHRQLPHLGNAGMGIKLYMSELGERLRRVRVCCGDWKRVTTPSVTEKNGITGIFLDPPYNTDRMKNIYNHDSFDVSDEVRDWAIENGDNPMLRIALCGYDGEHVMPDNWEIFAWKTKGGYGSQGDNQARDNAHLERIWFSPHCLKPDREIQQELFKEAKEEDI